MKSIRNRARCGLHENSQNTELEVLYHISHAIVRRRNIPALVNEVLDILRTALCLTRGALTLRRGDELFIETGFGLTEEEKARGKYRLGEGITGKVAETGRPAMVPDVSKDPAFLNRTLSRGTQTIEPVAFICVPVCQGNEVIGTLSIDHTPTTEEHLEHLVNLLITVANIVAEAVAALRDEVEERSRLCAENERLKQELGDQFRPSNIVGNSSAMRQVYAMIAQVAESSVPVLIRGESGTGKEMAARAIHYASPRRNGPFISVNCAALPESLIESELFGCEAGASIGANTGRKGRFDAAFGGTLFLDEIGDISPSVQIKLLRVLQEKTIERVGSQDPLPVNVRVITASVRNLEKRMSEGLFREDLFYRLNVFPILMPPLHARKSDIILLVDHFLEKYNRLHNKTIRRISTPAINMLMAYHWPGNVRELENTIERAVLMSGNHVLNAYDLPPSLQTSAESGTQALPEPQAGVDLLTLVSSFEREVIVEALKYCRGNVAAAARRLNTTERILHYRIEKLGINPKMLR